MPASANREKSAARATIEKAGAALARRRAEIPASFIEQLYGRACRKTWRATRPRIWRRLPRAPTTSWRSARPARRKSAAKRSSSMHSGDSNLVTVVEIVNDDMPFLVNSVMGEIAERKPEIRLVAHPVFGVRRAGTKLTCNRCTWRCGHARELYPYSSRADCATTHAANSCAHCKPCSAKCG